MVCSAIEFLCAKRSATSLWSGAYGMSSRIVHLRRSSTGIASASSRNGGSSKKDFVPAKSLRYSRALGIAATSVIKRPSTSDAEELMESFFASELIENREGKGKILAAFFEGFDFGRPTDPIDLRKAENVFGFGRTFQRSVISRVIDVINAKRVLKRVTARSVSRSLPFGSAAKGVIVRPEVFHAKLLVEKCCPDMTRKGEQAVKNSLAAFYEAFDGCDSIFAIDLLEENLGTALRSRVFSNVIALIEAELKLNETREKTAAELARNELHNENVMSRGSFIATRGKGLISRSYQEPTPPTTPSIIETRIARFNLPRQSYDED